MDSRINVAVRCRPLNEAESRLGRRSLVVCEDGVQVLDKRFSFETVFDETASQAEVYEQCVQNLVEGVFEGFNATVLAYGQTGSGKTYSIMGSSGDDDGNEEDQGVIPRAVKQIFHHLKTIKSTHVANVRVSMIELYNDECKDLLHPEIPSRDIMIREDKHGRIFFTGAREEVVTSVRGALEFLEIGNINRSTAETLMNQSSSRSHAIFTLSLEMIEYQREGNVEARNFIHAKLHLVDLAGSERAKKTGAVGTRFKESVGINQGLLALGKVIRALTSQPVTHVPYRDSKLTRFLQDSLGGNSRTVLLACVSSAESNTHETTSTLQYAHRARAVHNKVIANVSKAIGTPDELDLQAELESSLVASLRAQIAQMQSHPPQSSETVEKMTDEMRELRVTLQTCAQMLRGVCTTVQRMCSAPTLHEVREMGGQVMTTLREAIARSEGPTVLLRSSLRESISALQRLQEEKGENGRDDASRFPRSSLERDASSQEERIQSLQAELDECKEDLHRDEMIFAEKMKEIKTLRRQMKDLEKERNQLASHLSGLKRNVAKLTNRGRTVALIGDGVQEGGRRQHGVDSLPGEVDDLDISLAVAAAEPDISQLMEDLEVLAGEKERLEQCLEESLQRKHPPLKQQQQQQLAALLDAQDAWTREREDLLAQQEELSKRVKESEAKERDSRSRQESLQRRLHQLEQEIQEQKAKQRAAEEALQAIQSESRSHEQQAQDHVHRLHSEHQAYEQLTQKRLADYEHQVEELHGKLKLQASERRRWQQEAETYQSKEKAWEKQVTSLEASLQRMQKEQEQQPQGVREESDEEIRKRIGGKEGLADISHWLNQQIEDLVHLGIARCEIGKLQSTLDIMRQEYSSLQSDWKGKQQDQQQQIHQLQAQVQEMDDKIHSLSQRLHGAHQQRMGLTGQAKEELEIQIQDWQSSLEAYEEYKQESLSRLHLLQQGKGNAEMEDLREEMESLEADMAVTQRRLEEEQAKLSAQGERSRKQHSSNRTVDDILQDLQVYGQQRFRVASLASSAFLSRLLLQSVIAERITSGTRETSLHALQSQQEAKCTEYDSLVKNMQKMRKEHLRRLDQQRKEYEEKIAFLVQQLRSAEQRHQGGVGVSGSVAAGEGSGGLAGQSSLASSTLESLRKKARERRPSPVTSSGVPSAAASLNPAGLTHLLQSATRQTITQLLQSVAQERDREGASVPASMPLGNVNLEVVRRYAAEKERREQLERKNLEMARELRSLRDQR